METKDELKKEKLKKLKEKRRKTITRQEIEFTPKEIETMILIYKKKLTSTEIKKLLFKKEFMLVTYNSPTNYNNIITELKRIGNNLNQLTHVANSENRIKEHEFIKKELNDLWTTINSLKDDYKKH